MRQSHRLNPDLQATARQDADLLAALLAGDVGRLRTVLKERGDAELDRWVIPLPVYHAAVLGGRVEAVAVLVAAGASIQLAEQTVPGLTDGVLALLKQQAGEIEASALQQAAKGSQAAAALAAGSGRHAHLAAILAAGGLASIRGCCRWLTLAAEKPVWQAESHEAALAALGPALATLDCLLDSRGRQDDCVRAAGNMHHRLLLYSGDGGQVARAVSQWVMQRSLQYGDFVRLNAESLCAVLAMAASHGDSCQLRHFAKQLCVCPMALSCASKPACPGMSVLVGAASACDPGTLPSLLQELNCCCGGGDSGDSGGGGDSGSSSGCAGWRLLQERSRGALGGTACQAAKRGFQAAVQVLLHAGQLPTTIQLVNAAGEAPGLGLLKWLLAAGDLPVPAVHGVRLRHPPPLHMHTLHYGVN